MACCSILYQVQAVGRPLLIGIAMTTTTMCRRSSTAYSPTTKSRPLKGGEIREKAANDNKEQQPTAEMRTSRDQKKQTIVSPSTSPKQPKQQLKRNKPNSNSSLHILKDLYPWKTKAEFTQHLADNCVIYNSGMVNL